MIFKKIWYWLSTKKEYRNLINVLKEADREEIKE